MTPCQVESAAKWLAARHSSAYTSWAMVLRLDIHEELMLAGLMRMNSVSTTAGLALVMHRALLDIVIRESRRKANISPEQYEGAEMDAEIRSKWDHNSLGAFTDRSCVTADTIIDALALDDAMQPLHPEWRSLLVDLETTEALTADQRRRRSSIRRHLELAVEGVGRKIGSYVKEPSGVAKQSVRDPELHSSWPV